MDGAETGAVKSHAADRAAATTPACRKERDKAGAPRMKVMVKGRAGPRPHSLLFRENHEIIEAPHPI